MSQFFCHNSNCKMQGVGLEAAAASALGQKCPVCQGALVREGEGTSEPETTPGGKWKGWPTPVSIPLREYEEEEHSGARLWVACDTVEMLLRFLVIALVGERSRQGEVEEKMRGNLAQLIESPTLGAWFAMAQKLSEEKSGADELKQAKDFVKGPLRELLYGPENPGTDETSFLKLRNRLAHGGGMTRRESTRLLDLWQDRFEGMLEQLPWILDWALLGRNEAGEWIRIEETGKGVAEKAFEGVEEKEPDAVWLKMDGLILPLWPLMAFGKPSTHVEGKVRTLPEAYPQVYVRRESVRLGYTPLGAEGMGHSESSAEALQAFEALFKVKQSREQAGFKVADFTKEIRKDAGQVVGREAELEKALAMIHEREEGVLWMSGQAGMGKSFLMAKLTENLLAEHTEQRPLVLPYRFRAGDQDRCNRGSLAQFVVERLDAAGMLRESAEDKPDGKAEKRLENSLGGLKEDTSVVLVIDGLDEVTRRDSSFAEEIPLALRFPRVLWVCSGRPEPKLEESMKRLDAKWIFTEGLPPMREKDVRGMILEKIGPLRRKLLRNEVDKEDSVVNPFIELVTERAAGLPLYVKYVIGDVLGGKYRVLDGEEDLPDSLHTYHEELLRRLGVGDLQAVVTPLAATLAAAYEPLSKAELLDLFQTRNLVMKEGGGELIERGLAAISSMVTTAPDPEGEVGFQLFHLSLRSHILDSAQMKQSVGTARDALADLAEMRDPPEALENYLIRCGVRHLLEVKRRDAAEKLLLNLDHLLAMKMQGIGLPELSRYWEPPGAEERALQYIGVVEEVLSGGVTEELLEKVEFVQQLTQQARWMECALGLAEKTLVILKNTLGSEHPYTARGYNNLGNTHYDLKDYEESIEMFRQAEFILKEIHGQDVENAEIAQVYSDLGRAFSGKKMHEESLEYKHKAERIREQILGLDHPKTAETYNNLAVSYAAQGKKEEAAEYYDRSLEIKKRVFGSMHPEVALALKNLGIFEFQYHKNLEASLGYFEDSLIICRAVSGEDSRNAADLYPYVGYMKNELGDKEAAIENYRKAEMVERKLGNDENIKKWQAKVQELESDLESNKLSGG